MKTFLFHRLAALQARYQSLHRWAGVRIARHKFALARSGLTVELDGRRMGFFAQLSQCLILLHHAATTNQPVRVRLASENYADANRLPDWLGYYFDWISPEPGSSTGTIHIRHRYDIELDDLTDMPLQDANTLFFRHLRLRADLQTELDGFCRVHHLDANTLGVHYRGTDKGLEAPRITYKEAIATVIGYLKDRPNFTSVFIASDEGNFVESCKRALGNWRVVTYQNARPIQGNEPAHFGKRSAGNYLIGKDALMTALILSRCGAIVRTTSFLSAWASLFNPGLEVTLLNAPYPGKAWFPETEILKIVGRSPS